MIILHASILHDTTVLWAEEELESPVSNKHTSLSKRIQSNLRHPYAASFKRLQEVMSAANKDSASALIWLPTIAGKPLPSRAMLSSIVSESDQTPALQPWSVDILPVRARSLSDLLASAQSKHVLLPGILLSDEFRFLSLLLDFANSLIVREQYLPDMTEQDGAYFAKWRPIHRKEDKSRLSELASLLPPVLGTMQSLSIPASTQPKLQPLDLIASCLAGYLDDLVRQSIAAPSRKNVAINRLTKIPKQDQQHDSVHDCWIHALKSQSGLMNFDHSQVSAFASQLTDWQKPITAIEALPFRLCFRLDEPALDEFETTKEASTNWNVTYFLQDLQDQSLLIPAHEAWRSAKQSTRTCSAGNRFTPREYLLLSLGQASGLSAKVADSLRTNCPEGFSLDSNGAFEFLSEKAAALEQAGFGVMLPSWWSKGNTKSRLKVSASVKSPTLKAMSGLTMERLVEFDWKVALGDVPLSLAQLTAIAEMKAPLVNIRGQWVHVSADDIQAAIDFLKRKASSSASIHDLVQYSLGAKSPFASGQPITVEATGWIGELLKQLEEPAKIKAIPMPEGFTGQLRPYQQRGFAWLSFLGRWGLGACLADDMGLGKTVQTLALIQEQRMQGEQKPVLLVCPTSVVNNWRKEAHRFTPDLSLLIHHGGTRLKADKFREEVNHHALVISSYSLLHRDFDHLKEIEWAGLILDEAQNIKNSGTKQALAARQLSSRYRVALTGTPVENSVGDLWSIMEFLNPGLLGNQNAFRKNFFYPIQVQRDQESQERLKRITQPFVLRRLKTDKSIIGDLPEKQEMNVYCSLTKEQVTLYSAVLKDLENKLKQSEGIQRKGLILATLAKLKQVCNHPAHFLADNSALEARSGKLDRLLEMLEEVLAAGEKALIFTQFVEMGELIKQHIENNLGEEVLFLHGGINKNKRDKMVDRFQHATSTDALTNSSQATATDTGPSIFVLSLKAGGTGLNLTAANHVFHFDRWWNPAVENQASDRAFRIGQRKNVQVWKFICAGTLEEKIDEMIESKRQLAEGVIGTGEGWLTELSNTELKKVFALTQEARAD